MAGSSQEKMTLSSEELRRHLYDKSEVFTRAAHALVAAADQLREAHRSDFAKAAIEAQSAAMVAMHAALSAHRLVGAYELACWLQGVNERAKGSKCQTVPPRKS